MVVEDRETATAYPLAPTRDYKSEASKDLEQLQTYYPAAYITSRMQPELRASEPVAINDELEFDDDGFVLIPEFDPLTDLPPQVLERGGPTS